MGRPHTRTGPEWRGQVGFFNGRRWIEVPIGVRAMTAHVAAGRAVKEAKLTLRKGLRIEEIKVSLRRIVSGMYDAPDEGGETE